MTEFSQEELAAILRIIFETEGLNDQNVLIEIDEGVLIEEATAAPVSAPAAAPAAAPENVPSEPNQLPNASSDDEEPKEVIGMGHASDSDEDLQSGINPRADLRGSMIQEGWGVGRWVSRGWWSGGQGSGEWSDSEMSSVETSDPSSDYDPADDSDEESDADVNVGSRFWVLSDTSISCISG